MKLLNDAISEKNSIIEKKEMFENGYTLEVYRENKNNQIIFIKVSKSKQFFRIDYLIHKIELFI